jgi:tripartite-type tricarboxylate transporter receptor subunit TctC
MTLVLRLGLTVAISLMAGIGLAHSADPVYPTKPIRIIVQFTPGTSTDIFARVIAQKMGEDWGQQVVVDNRPGAGGVVGTEIGAKAAPAKTPTAILDKLNAEMVRILNQPDVKERLNTLAFTPVGDTRAQFAAYIKSEIAKWGKAVKESGAKVD